jgi:hypothetical protein
MRIIEKISNVNESCSVYYNFSALPQTGTQAEFYLLGYNAV